MASPEMDPVTADVLHTAVHDLRGPANRLRLLVQVLQRESAALDDDSRRLLGHIGDSAAAVDAVAEGLRTYAEIGTRPLRRCAVKLDRALASARSGIRAEIESTGAEITSAGLPEIAADPFLMTWLFEELLRNAIRFHGEGSPCVHVSCGEGGPGGWFVSVRDNGPGIAAGAAGRVFRPFRKQSAGPTAGLGLAICRRIVEMHGGRIWLEPRDGGADFRFFIAGSPPADQEPA